MPDFSDENIVMRLNAIHVYGVDYMSTKMILSYFGEENKVRVEWLNDSSCNVAFNSPHTMQEVVKKLVFNA